MRINFLWRLLAFGMLLVYVALVLTVLRLLVHNVGLAIMVSLSVGAIVYALWLLFALGRRLGWQLLVLGVAGLVGSGIWFVHGAHNWRMVVAFGGLTVVYLGLVGLLRYEYWRQRRRIGLAAAGVAHFRQPYLIINPKSGNGRAVRAGIADLARRQGIEVIMLSHGDDVESLAQRAADAGADVLGISGGDGSIGAVAKVASERGLPMVVLPGGTRCHFARDLGLNPKHIADALNGFTGVARQIDIGDINGRIFLNNASFGLYADIVSHPDYRAHKVRVSRTVLTELARGQRPLYALRIRHGERRFDGAVQVLVGVGAYETLNVFELGQRRQLDSGELQVTTITRLDDAMVRRLLKTLSFAQGHVAQTGSGLEQWTSRELTITSPEGVVKVGVDGEFEEYSSPVRLRVHPRALTIYVPVEGERGRAHHAFDPELVRRTWHMAAHGRD
jgi:diacylglycerol kinase family enzyme